jgi:Putative Actinobacterial Holin-X, holin superfamily III
MRNVADCEAGRPRLGAVASGLLRGTRDLASDYALLAVLDARGAAIRFAWLVCVGLVAAILVVTAWISLVVAGIVWAIGTGASWIAALGVAAAINLVAAGLLARRMRGLLAEMPFAATLRQLRGDAPASTEGRDP